MKFKRTAFKTIALMLLLVFPVQAADVVTYYHTDSVGTPLLMTDANGEKIWEADYKPFGEEYAIDATQENNRRFVGKERDAETGLDYFGARYLSTTTGRFLAVDPVRAVDGGSGQINASIIANPQRLNSYAYSLNNPYRYVDPDGRAVWGVNLGGSFTVFGVKASFGFALLLDSKGHAAIVPNGDWGAGAGKAIGVFANAVAGLEGTTVDDYGGGSASVSGSVSVPGTRRGVTFAVTKPDDDKTFVEAGYSPLSFGSSELGVTVGYGEVYRINISKMVLGNLGERAYDFFHKEHGE